MSLTIKAVAERMNATLDTLLPMPTGPEARVVEAMRYAALDGGKRLRPFLVLATAELFAVPEARSLRAAAAVEMIHCYSLIHDDLPCMDDDDLRRGRPTCHKAFDEETALLAGDGLQARAFEILAEAATHPDADVRCALVRLLADAAGSWGMVGGQMFDLRAQQNARDLEAVIRLQGMKTGRLIGFSCEAGAILGQADAAQRAMLRDYAQALGLAFQIADDLLDVTGDEADMGKKLGKDAAAGKVTFVSLLGVAEARKRAESLVADAVTALSAFGAAADPLRDIARFVITRQN